MSSPHQHARIQIAQQLTQALHVSDLQHVAIVGSVGRGLCDAYSDLELFLVWNEPPTDDQRDAVLQASSAVSFRRFTRDAPWFAVDNVAVHHPGAPDGFLVDVIHQTSASLTALAERAPTASLADQEALANLVWARWLRGHWPAVPYPPALAHHTLATHLRFTALGGLWLPAVRHDLVRFAARRVRWAHTIALVLHAANHRYWPGDRAVDHALAELPRTPPQAAQRLRAAMVAEPEPAVQALSELAVAAVTLAAQHVPQWDPEPLQERLTLSRRIAWELDTFDEP
ncbi:MAG: hypothetical protein KTR31_04045 [Myxococcales bacterium]|nr:hypothetical protein [Myxococcales bacterium]